MQTRIDGVTVNQMLNLFCCVVIMSWVRTSAIKCKIETLCRCNVGAKLYIYSLTICWVLHESRIDRFLYILQVSCHKMGQSVTQASWNYNVTTIQTKSSQTCMHTAYDAPLFLYIYIIIYPINFFVHSVCLFICICISLTNWAQ